MITQQVMKWMFDCINAILYRPYCAYTVPTCSATGKKDLLAQSGYVLDMDSLSNSDNFPCMLKLTCMFYADEAKFQNFAVERAKSWEYSCTFYIC